MGSHPLRIRTHIGQTAEYESAGYLANPLVRSWLYKLRVRLKIVGPRSGQSLSPFRAHKNYRDDKKYDEQHFRQGDHNTKSGFLGRGNPVAIEGRGNRHTVWDASWRVPGSQPVWA